MEMHVCLCDCKMLFILLVVVNISPDIFYCIQKTEIIFSWNFLTVPGYILL